MNNTQVGSSEPVILTLSRPPWLLVWPNTFSTVQSCRGYACWPANLSPLMGCSGLQRLACSSMSENRKNILGLASAPFGGTILSQPSRMYHLPVREGNITIIIFTFVGKLMAFPACINKTPGTDHTEHCLCSTSLLKFPNHLTKEVR